MNVEGRVAIVTGAARGIGAALARALAGAGARVVVADVDRAGADAVADALEAGSAIAHRADASSAEDLADLIAAADRAFGPVEIFCANAGILGGTGIPDDATWNRAIEVNVMAHVRAARLLLPGWLERGEGYFVATASAAGLLTEMGVAPYAVTKHAAVAFAEWLAIAHGDDGVRVSCVCPQAVNTGMLAEGLSAAGSEAAVGARATAASGDVLEPERVAECVLEAIADETFLVLPHPEVLTYFRRKAGDYERWLRGMRKLRSAATSEPRRS